LEILPIRAASHNHVSNILEVKSLSPKRRFVIALRSPGGIGQTGLPERPPEKTSGKLALCAQRDIFSVPIWGEEAADLRRFTAILGRLRRGFSAIQTEWRRAGDSNPQYRLQWYKSRRVRDLQGIHLFSGGG
jgi:hypothetical protein